MERIKDWIATGLIILIIIALFSKCSGSTNSNTGIDNKNQSGKVSENSQKNEKQEKEESELIDTLIIVEYEKNFFKNHGKGKIYIDNKQIDTLEGGDSKEYQYRMSPGTHTFKLDGTFFSNSNEVKFNVSEGHNIFKFYLEGNYTVGVTVEGEELRGTFMIPDNVAEELIYNIQTGNKLYLDQILTGEAYDKNSNKIDLLNHIWAKQNENVLFYANRIALIDVQSDIKVTKDTEEQFEATIKIKCDDLEAVYKQYCDYVVSDAFALEIENSSSNDDLNNAKIDKLMKLLSENKQTVSFEIKIAAKKKDGQMKITKIKNGSKIWSNLLIADSAEEIGDIEASEELYSKSGWFD